MRNKAITLPINAIVGISFSLVGLLSFFRHTLLDAGTWLAIGIAFLFMFDETRTWQARPLWQRSGAIVFLLAGIGLLLTRIFFDFSAK